MSIEIQMLVWSMVLGLVHVFAPSTLITRERGIGWNASARDQPMPPPGPLAGRLQRALGTFIDKQGDVTLYFTVLHLRVEPAKDQLLH